MTKTNSPNDLRQLQKLYAFREKRALEAIAVQRIEVDRVQCRLKEQQALIAGLKDELLALHQMRAAGSIKNMTCISLRVESDRRVSLSNDLDLEVFYLPGFESDLEEAQLELAVRQKSWARIGDQIKGLEQLESKNKSKALRIQSRKEDALLDDRRATVQQ